MAQEGTTYSVVGPPGTGKTTYIAKQVERLVETQDPETLLLASFTRSAAATLAGRIQLPKEQIGTLHALAYRYQNHPELAETPEALAEWNDTHPTLDRKISKTGKINLDDDAAGAQGWDDTPTGGDELLAELNIQRAKMRPPDKWPARVRAFNEDWTAFKERTGTKDFTDLIEHALRDDVLPPARAEVGFFDEVQDFTRLENALVRRWSRAFTRTVLVGDSDQCVYSFKGADPLVLTDGVDPANVRVLSQSYRVPRAVHAVAQGIVSRIPKRLPVEYKPRDEDGAVYRERGVTFKDPMSLERVLERTPDGSVMILATAGYMLNPVLAWLRDQGIPYHNPYRKIRSDWNPLAVTTGVNTVDRVTSYLLPPQSGDLWTFHQLAAWVPLVRTDVFHRGAKAAIARLADDHPAPHEVPTVDQLLEWFQPEHLDLAFTGDPTWLKLNLHKKYNTNKTHLVINTVKRSGLGATRATPRIVVGTIHSVKGAEADHVVLYPDLSKKGFAAYLAPGNARDAVTRTMYVGATRARQTLTLCGPSGLRYPWPE